MGLIPQTLSRSVERYGLGYIRPRHNEIARRLVMGQKQRTISKDMGIDEGRLSIIVNSPLFKIVLARLSKLRDDSAVDIQEELKELAPIALEQVAKTMMNGASEKLRLSASQDVLDRAGVIKKGQGLNVGIQVNVNPVDLNKYRDDAITVEVKEIDKGNGDELSVETQLADAEALKCKGSGVQPVNKSKSNGDEELAEDLKLLNEAIAEPVAEEVDSG